MKTQTEIARKREMEMSNLYAFSRRLASSSSAADIHLAIEELSFPKIRSGLDSHRGIESSHDPGDAYNPALARNVRRRLVQAAMSA
jgi:hypothetical protein